MLCGTRAQIEVCQLAVQRLSSGHSCAPNKQLSLVCLCVFASVKVVAGEGVTLIRTLTHELGSRYTEV